MGTRADFYVGVGEQAEWLGSIAWDGNPEGIKDTPKGEEAVRKSYAAPHWRPSDIEEFIRSDAACEFGQHILTSTDEDAYRAAVSGYVTAREDGTLPERGWPWPWDTSATTDYAYFFFEGKVLASSFGGALFDPLGIEPDEDNDIKPVAGPPILPDMSERKKVRFDKGSGLLVMHG